eukprot:CAMPEP_0197942138 /NCGR_PEP_ID=MMETSP1439-20131203/123875_1 /TAXON_ID=66791 /ORGANISM="Gonyaulax spinifera, Strain CCMP409" /LENGTH=32 /DNA_ID= /DNA_START= /DNA_END= /DNA_ORIENTATION=
MATPSRFKASAQKWNTRGRHVALRDTSEVDAP